MSDFKLIGHNYRTPDIVAKVMGRAKYAEDFRAEGMLFCKLLRGIDCARDDPRLLWYPSRKAPHHQVDDFWLDES